ncbi:hypothetical protein BN1708_005578 [Verticillium longisporum]|uniref:Amino acid permease/ SLC12A domain-containing protein n=1 Tax=Verticillium longisporum TaxID=100787 RepID=A0A0G4MBZ0_VERLO|nr:hypothetical protein BN1708_005578 [Verticillium longisporum]
MTVESFCVTKVQQTFQDPCYGSAASQNGQTQISEDSTTDAIHPQGAVLDANNTAPKVLSLARVQHAMQQPSSGQNSTMSADKEDRLVYGSAADLDGDGIDEKRGNANDRADMYRMGKKQEMKHGTLLTIAVAAFSVLFNTVLARKLPLIKALVLIILIFGFFGILVTLWVLSPRAEPKAVFTEFFDGWGWGSLGGSALIGITAGILPLLGADAAVHMSEEVRDAGRTLPRSMIITTVINGGLGWIMRITYCFCIGDLFEVLETPTGYPFMQVFLNSTQSASSATAMAVFVVAMAIFSNLTMVATASRQLFAFARDNAVPLNPWFAKVPAGWDVPLNAIFTTFLISSLLSLINIGSAVALNSITSLATTSLLSSYICSTGCMIWRRWTNSPLLPSKFRLVVFLVAIFVLAFMPPTPNPTLDMMNWNILIYSVIALFSLAYYLVRGTHQYEGPVAYVRTLAQ